jgi:hypothetical protein
MKRILSIIGFCLLFSKFSNAAPVGYIQSTGTLQSGTTFYVSSGTIVGGLNLYGNLRVQDANLVLAHISGAYKGIVDGTGQTLLKISNNQSLCSGGGCGVNHALSYGLDIRGDGLQDDSVAIGWNSYAGASSVIIGATAAAGYDSNWSSNVVVGAYKKWDQCAKLHNLYRCAMRDYR